jgi:putative exporter of polyketide antibiotics
MKNSILFCVLVLFIASCASTGNQTLKSETESSVAAKIVNNVTTQAEIKAMFGSPYQTTYTDGGLEIWKYQLDDLKADAINYVPIVNFFGSSYSGTRKELVILFNDDGTVKRNSMAESDVKTKSGLFN